MLNYDSEIFSHAFAIIIEQAQAIFKERTFGEVGIKIRWSIWLKISTGTPELSLPNIKKSSFLKLKSQ